jgi:tellurite resistance protein TerB
MSFWTKLKENVSQISGELKTKVAQFRNDAFAEASMAMCALIAAADGSIDPQEKEKTTKLILNNDTLSVFEAETLRQKFEKFAGKLEKDYDFGKIDAIQAIGKLKSKSDQARAVIQVGIIIGGADGDFDDDEKQAVKEACHALDIDPAEYDLT